MANKKITDLMSGTPARDSLLESAIDISGTMDSRKVIAGAIADLASANVAAAYNSATTYAIGQYCLYEGDIYRCIAITTGTFDATKWTQIVVTSEFRRVVELTTAQYEALSSAEKNNGTLYVLTDEETTAADIPYSSGVSVADKLDNVPTFDTLTTSDNNKLLCVIVSGDDIGVGAVDSQGAFEYQTKTLTYNGVDFVFTRRGHVCSVSVNHNSQVAYSTQWTSIGSLSSTYFNTGTQLIGMVIPGGNTLMFRLAYNGDVDIMCNANTNIWAQGTAVYLV